jgi:hypothetical protein
LFPFFFFFSPRLFPLSFHPVLSLRTRSVSQSVTSLLPLFPVHTRPAVFTYTLMYIYHEISYLLAFVCVCVCVCVCGVRESEIIEPAALIIAY